jgi:hypothetical protein
MGESIMYLQFPTFREGRRDNKSKARTEFNNRPVDYACGRDGMESSSFLISNLFKILVFF